MKLFPLARLVLALCFLTAAAIQIQAQICSDCEIPSAQRTARLNAANQALQTADSQQNALNDRHCPWGLPKSPSSARNERLLYQFEWITLYDEDLVMPLWVTYELTRTEASSTVATRQDCFRRDQRIGNELAAFCEDFEEPLFDRGHMVPAMDLKRAQSSMDNGFLFSNMAPQYGEFNRGIWEKLESKVNGWARGKDGIFVITGAIFDKDGNGKRDKDQNASRVAPRNRMAVATHFYKILLKRHADGRFETIAFLMPHDRRTDNDTTPAITNQYLNSKIETIDKIEKLTGINFFPNMASNKQKKIEKNKAASLDNWFVF